VVKSVTVAERISPNRLSETVAVRGVSDLGLGFLSERNKKKRERCAGG
jgi:hypothetical protein